MADEFANVLISYIDPQGNFLEHELLQRGSLWGVGRLAHARPLLARPAAPFLSAFYQSPDPYLRGTGSLRDRIRHAVLFWMAALLVVLAGSGTAQAARVYANRQDGKLVDSALRDRLVQHDMNSRALGLTHARAFEERLHGVADPGVPLMMKYVGTEEEKRKKELLVALMGNQGLGWEGGGFSEQELLATRGMLFSKALSIAGGTSEVQLNIIAKRALGLPDGMKAAARIAILAGIVLLAAAQAELGNFEQAEQLLERLELISFAESLGGAETLITLPALQTHADIPEEQLRRMGICGRLLRLSVGLEEPADLIADLDQAFRRT